MKIYNLFIIVLLGNNFLSFSQIYSEKNCSIKINNSFKLYGTQFIPNNNLKKTICLIISGSGPTDRNGNSPGVVNNTLKFLAEDLEE